MKDPLVVCNLKALLPRPAFPHFYLFTCKMLFQPANHSTQNGTKDHEEPCSEPCLNSLPFEIVSHIYVVTVAWTKNSILNNSKKLKACLTCENTLIVVLHRAVSRADRIQKKNEIIQRMKNEKLNSLSPLIVYPSTGLSTG